VCDGGCQVNADRSSLQPPLRRPFRKMPIPEEVRLTLLTEVRTQLRTAPEKVVCLRNMDMEFKPSPGEAPTAIRGLLSGECTSFGFHDFDLAGVPTRLVYDDEYLSRCKERVCEPTRNNIASDMFQEEIYGDVYLQARV